MILQASLIGLAFTVAVTAQHDPVADATHVRIQTTMGDIDVELARDAAPLTTANFVRYAVDGFYDRLQFHRVVEGSLIQGGGYSASWFERPVRDPVPSEADSGLTNDRGTIAMARLADPDSATSQFFINLDDNAFLDRSGNTYDSDEGYTVFGRVVSGMSVADAIGGVETGPGGNGPIYFESEVPVQPVLIERIDPIDPSELVLSDPADGE